MKRVLLVYNTRLTAGRPTAEGLARIVQRAGWKATLLPVDDPDEVTSAMPEAGIAISPGGDGTILRTARSAAPYGVPVLGVNLGELGFLAELTLNEASDRLPFFLEGRAWIERRSTLEAIIERMAGQVAGDGVNRGQLAINDVAVGRGRLSRVVRVRAFISGAYLTTYVADGVVVATPTGSTAHSLAAGGPILDPELDNITLTPLAPHLTARNSLVLPSTDVVTLEVHTRCEATVSVDGQIDFDIQDGDRVTIRVGEMRSLFLRSHPRGHFYETLFGRLRQGNNHSGWYRDEGACSSVEKGSS